MTITTSIEINSTPSKVWEILSDFENYNQWNPFITSIKGNLIAGEKLNVRINTMQFKPQLLVVKPEQEIEWLGQLLIPKLFDGKHKFTITKRNNKVIFEQSETFTGLLVPVFKNKINTEIKSQFQAMNLALKQICEQRA